MKIAKLPETKLRQYIEPRMRDQWMMTWHEDREITPGVPDLHYVMKGAPGEKYRVGWLELKAIDTKMSKSNRIGVEPSQHQYIRRWDEHMPIHFLIRIQDRIYVVPGKYSPGISAAATLNDIIGLSDINFDQSQISEVLPPFLKEITKI